MRHLNLHKTHGINSYLLKHWRWSSKYFPPAVCDVNALVSKTVAVKGPTEDRDIHLCSADSCGKNTVLKAGTVRWARLQQPAEANKCIYQLLLTTVYLRAYRSSAQLIWIKVSEQRGSNSHITATQCGVRKSHCVFHEVFLCTAWKTLICYKYQIPVYNKHKNQKPKTWN